MVPNRRVHPKSMRFTGERFYGLRVGRLYFKLRDIELHPLLFSERNGHSYRRIARVGVWEFGVRFK